MGTKTLRRPVAGPQRGCQRFDFSQSHDRNEFFSGLVGRRRRARSLLRHDEDGSARDRTSSGDGIVLMTMRPFTAAIAMAVAALVLTVLASAVVSRTPEPALRLVPFAVRGRS